LCADYSRSIINIEFAKANKNGGLTMKKKIAMLSLVLVILMSSAVLFAAGSSEEKASQEETKTFAIDVVNPKRT
jgi:hypothetical protein